MPSRAGEAAEPGIAPNARPATGLTHPACPARYDQALRNDVLYQGEGVVPHASSPRRRRPGAATRCSCASTAWPSDAKVWVNGDARRASTCFPYTGFDPRRHGAWCARGANTPGRAGRQPTSGSDAIPDTRSAPGGGTTAASIAGCGWRPVPQASATGDLAVATPERRAAWRVLDLVDLGAHRAQLRRRAGRGADFSGADRRRADARGVDRRVDGASLAAGATEDRSWAPSYGAQCATAWSPGASRALHRLELATRAAGGA